MMKAIKGTRGFTLHEVAIAVVIAAILFSQATMRYQKIAEHSRMDLAAVQLNNIWLAQGLYHSAYGIYATTVSTLEEARLLDAKFFGAANSQYRFAIVQADDDTFEAVAARVGSGIWSGEISVDEEGMLSGEVRDSRGESIRPGGTA